VAFPIWTGWAFDHLGMSVPFVTSAVLVIGTLWLGAGMEGYVMARPERAAAAD
jgi:hypothetical protein